MASLVSPRVEHNNLLKACLSELRQQMDIRTNLFQLQDRLSGFGIDSQPVNRIAEDLNARSNTDLPVFTQFAQAASRRLFNNVYTKLPAEIRLMIYDYLLTDEVPEVFISEPLEQSVVIDNKNAIWWNRDYSCDKIVHEILAHHLSATCLRFNDRFDLVRQIRYSDPWCFGINIGNIKLNVEVTLFARTGHIDESDGSTTGEFRELKKDILDDLELLFGFRAGTKLTLEIYDFNPVNDFADLHGWTSDTLLPFMFNTLERLTLQDFRIHLAMPILVGVNACISLYEGLDCLDMSALQDRINNHFGALRRRVHDGQPRLPIETELGHEMTEEDDEISAISEEHDEDSQNLEDGNGVAPVTEAGDEHTQIPGAVDEHSEVADEDHDHGGYSVYSDNDSSTDFVYSDSDIERAGPSNRSENHGWDHASDRSSEYWSDSEDSSDRTLQTRP